MSHPLFLWRVNKRLMKHFSRSFDEVVVKIQFIFFSRSVWGCRAQACEVELCCWSLGCAVSNGCDISQQLLLTPLHCCRWGVWLTRHTVSAPVCTQWTLTLYKLYVNGHTEHPLHSPTFSTLMLPLRHTPTLCISTSQSSSFTNHCWRTQSYNQLS